MTQRTYLEAAVVGLIQGVTEPFPVSSLGRNVLILVRYFETRTLTPFGIYCIVAGLAGITYLYLVKYPVRRLPRITICLVTGVTP